MNHLSTDELETLLAETHVVLRDAGVATHVWTRLRCTCNRPECEIHDPERHTLTLQFHTLAAHWPEGGADAATEARLAGALGRLRDLLGDPHASTRLSMAGLLHHVRDLWLAGMGTPLGGPPDDAWLEQLAAVEARNFLLLGELLKRLAGVPFLRLADAGAEHARRSLSRRAAEGTAACRRAVAAWIPDHDALPARTLLREHLLALINDAPWSAVETQDVVRMTEDAAHAVLAFGIADDMWVRESFGAMEIVAPFAALRTALILGELAVPPPQPTAP